MDIKKVAREIVEGSAVLLKNEGALLPLAPGKTVAYFGRAQLDTVMSGSGSGAARAENPSSILEECEKKGIAAAAGLKAFYVQEMEKVRAAAAAEHAGFDLSKLKDLVNSGLMYEIFGKFTPPSEEFALPEELVKETAAETDTAVLVIGRKSGGEECDRHLTDDYYLIPSERALVEQVCTAFSKVVVILNINGLIDLRWLETYPSVKSVLFLGVAGEQGPQALAELLCGEVSPSGKLCVSVAREYEDYPAAPNFSWDKDHPENIKTYEDYGLDPAANGSKGFSKSPATVYQEDIYLGYRYFDAFGKKPMFPFGFGLSYTTFAVSGAVLAKEPGGLKAAAQVENTGTCAGREVLQLYVAAKGGETPRPVKELKGFVKTGLLQPGEKETVSVFVPWSELACYSEKKAAWVIEKGVYAIELGASSAETEIVGSLGVVEDITVLATANRLSLRDCNRGKIDFFTRPAQAAPAGGTDLVLTAAEVTPLAASAPAAPQPDWSAFTDQELAALCVGYGPGLPFAALRDVPDPVTVMDENGQPVTTNTHPSGANGYVSPAIEKKGIRSISYKDGPAGVGITAWPSEMLLACSFDVELCEKFGNAVGCECEEAGADVWLAPAVNLHRHPLGGRNFEYLSEDPCLAGLCACAIADGVQKNHPVIVCAKHFAVNEQETYRRGSAKLNYDTDDSVLTERAARELYLKPFEMLVRRSGLRCIMTSFNKINGVFAGGSKDLCTHILREEWGFDGVVVTDWGDMDIVVDGADAVAAGNDIVMPGGPPVIAQILKGYEEGRVTRQELETAVSHLLSVLSFLGRYA